MSEVITSVEPRDCPYFGLDYYQEKFGAWFFGREVEGDKIITNLQAARLTLLHAESGVGKSSLLRAGVAWRLRQLAEAQSPSSGAVIDLPVVFSSWKDDPVRELIGEIRAMTEPFLAGRAATGLLSGRLDTAIEAAAEAADASLLVILDQFEEYFLYCSREPTPEHFADELARCINQADVPANFLISIREDAYAGLGDLFKGRIANVYGNYLHIEYLDRGAAEQAIRAPLDVYNRQSGIGEPVTIQDELVDAVLDQVRAYDADGEPAQGGGESNGSAGRVATPLLQLVMERVWQRERTQGSHELRLSTLESMEGVGKIVDAHLGRALHALDNGERETAIDVFDHLVTPSGGKIAESVPDLAHRTGHSEDQVGGVLGKLDHDRIVRSVPAPPGQDTVRFRRYEIFHDVLASAINRVIAARDEQRRARLRTRRLLRWTAVALCLFVAALALGGFFLYLLHKTATERQLAQSRELAAAAGNELTRDPILSALLAVRALHIATTTQAEEALRSALADTQEVRTFQNGTVVYGAVFDPANANEVVSAGQSGNAWIWDVATGRHLVHFLPPGGFKSSGAATAVAFNQNGTEVAVGYQNGQVALFDAKSGYRAQVISVGPIIRDVQFVGRTGELAIATYKGAGLWLPQELSHCCHMFFKGMVSAIAVNPHNDLEFALAGYSGAQILKLRKNLSPVHPGGLSLRGPRYLQDNDAEFSPDGKHVVAAGNDGVVRVYDVATAKMVATLNAGHGGAETAAFSPNGNLIVAGYSSGAAVIWDASSHLEQMQLNGSNGPVYGARFSANSRKVVTAGGDGTIRVWQAQPREMQASFSTLTPSPVYTAQYSPRGGQILVEAQGFAELRTSTGNPVGYVSPPGGASVNSVRFDQSGTKIVSADSDGTVDLWRPVGSGYSELPKIPLHSSIHLSGPASYAAFSLDGSRIVVVTNNETAEVFNARTGQWLHTLNPHTSYQLAVAAFDGSQILTGDYNGQVQVWNATTGRELRVLGAQGPAITDIEVASAGGDFVTASNSGFVTIWSAHDKPLHSIYACPSPYTASFSRDGSQVVVACPDGTVMVFGANGQQIAAMSDPGSANSAEFSPHGDSIVTAFALGDSGGIRIWDAELATYPRSALERLAWLRINPNLTAAERKAADLIVSGSGGP
jgi:WD40 repeat protein